MATTQKEHSQLRHATVDTLLPMLMVLAVAVLGHALTLRQAYIPAGAGAAIALWRLWVYTPGAQQRSNRKHGRR